MTIFTREFEQGDIPGTGANQVLPFAEGDSTDPDWVTIGGTANDTITLAQGVYVLEVESQFNPASGNRYLTVFDSKDERTELVSRLGSSLPKNGGGSEVFSYQAVIVAPVERNFRFEIGQDSGDGLYQYTQIRVTKVLSI